MGKRGTEKLRNLPKVTQINKNSLLNKIWVMLLWGRKNTFFSTLLGSWLRLPPPPVINNRLTGEKQTEDDMFTSYIQGRYPGKLRNSPKWPKPPPQTTFFSERLKKMLGEGEVGYGRLPGKAQQSRVWLLCRFKSLPSPSIRLSRDLNILLFQVQRGRPGYKWRFPL